MVATLFSFALAVAVAAGHPFWPGQPQQGSGHGGWHSPYNKTHPWRSSNEGNARSPCPALNALANEGYLPSSGRNITTALATTAFSTALNFSSTFIASFAAGAIAQCSNLTATTCTSFDLDMLNVPHMIEHDGSLSRQDFNYGRGDNRDFNAMVWGQVLGIWENASVIDVGLAEEARVARMVSANKTDLPGWFEPIGQQSLGESSFYLAAFQEPGLQGVGARKEWVHYFFSEERLPWHLGWVTPESVITADVLFAIIGALAEA